MRSIFICGKVRPILFRLRALRVYSELTKCNLLKEDIQSLISGEDINKLVAFIYSALECASKEEALPFDLTPEQVEQGLNLDATTFLEVVAAFGDIITAIAPNDQALQQTGPKD